MVYLLFAAGFVLLLKSADFLVEGSSSIAKTYNLSELVIGLTIVSFGTSMPELVVNLLASASGRTEIAIGNVFGSNIVNILLILGISALIKPLPIQRSIYFTEIPILLVATFMVGFLANANLFSTTNGLALSRLDGYMLLLFFGLFMTYIFVIARLKKNNSAGPEELAIRIMPKWKSYLYILIGLAGLFLGGKWVVDGAVEIAKFLGLSDAFVGLTVIAIGTSLPELVTSAVAAHKGKAGIAVGNVIGSNIFNIFWILGLSAAIIPLPFDVANNIDILVMIISSTLLIFAIIIGKRPQISRLEGSIFLVVYGLYLTYLLFRG